MMGGGFANPPRAMWVLSGLANPKHDRNLYFSKKETRLFFTDGRGVPFTKKPGFFLFYQFALYRKTIL